MLSRASALSSSVESRSSVVLPLRSDTTVLWKKCRMPLR
jgi:hypothetical protein